MRGVLHQGTPGNVGVNNRTLTAIQTMYAACIPASCSDLTSRRVFTMIASAAVQLQQEAGLKRRESYAMGTCRLLPSVKPV